MGVIGLGYVGLPLIQAFIKAGFSTIGYDVDQAKVDQLLAGKSYISHIPAQWIAECIASERFTPTADMARLSEADCLLICVPTPLNESRDPDLSFIEATGTANCRRFAPRPIGRAGKHDLSGHNARSAAADPGSERPDGRRRFLPGLQPRTRRSR